MTRALGHAQHVPEPRWVKVVVGHSSYETVCWLQAHGSSLLPGAGACSTSAHSLTNTAQQLLNTPQPFLTHLLIHPTTQQLSYVLLHPAP